MQSPSPGKSFDPWQATQVLNSTATRIMGSDEYLGRNVSEVGTRVGDHDVEIFAACPPAEALQRQLEAQQPTFIVVHDLGAAMSSRFLAELAKALDLPLQTLTIRRQGAGVTLATLQFIELPTAKGAPPGPPLRVYATAADADTTTRRLLADALLAFSRLGVLLVGPVAPHAVTAQFAPLRERLSNAPWHNKQLILVPAAAPSPELAEQARRLVADTPVLASITPVAADTAGRWGYIHGAWNRLRNNLPETRLNFESPASAAPPAVTAPVTQPGPLPVMQPQALVFTASFADAMATAPGHVPSPLPLPMRPMPATGPAAAVRLGVPQLSRYAQACAALKGSLGCCLFEWPSGRPVAHAGCRGSVETIAAQGIHLLAAVIDSGARLGDPGGIAECLITLERQLLFVRQLPQQPALGMLAAFDRALANPMLVRVQLQRLEPLLDAE
jgi:hypothetical protein